jgi:hypothetical protein
MPTGTLLSRGPLASWIRNPRGRGRGTAVLRRWWPGLPLTVTPLGPSVSIGGSNSLLAMADGAPRKGLEPPMHTVGPRGCSRSDDNVIVGTHLACSSERPDASFQGAVPLKHFHPDMPRPPTSLRGAQRQSNLPPDDPSWLVRRGIASPGQAGDRDARRNDERGQRFRSPRKCFGPPLKFPAAAPASHAGAPTPPPHPAIVVPRTTGRSTATRPAAHPRSCRPARRSRDGSTD